MWIHIPPIHLKWQSSPPQLTWSNIPYHIESHVNTHPSGSAFLDHFNTHNLIYNLIISLLPLKISSFIRLLCQQMAQDSCLLPPLSLLSAGTIATVAVAATTAPVIFSITATTAAYFPVAGTAAFMFPSPPPMFPPPPLPLPLCSRCWLATICFRCHHLTKIASLQVVWCQRRRVEADTMVKLVRSKRSILDNISLF